MDRIKDIVLSLVRSGVFGDGAEFVKLTWADQTDKVDGFASNIVFCKLTYRLGGSEKDYKFLAKQQSNAPVLRALFRNDVQFQNEVVMYRDIIPLLDREVQNCFAKLLFGCATGGSNPDDDILLLEDVGQAGYVTTRDKLTLDFAHCSLVMKKLGQFHSTLYAFKALNRGKFEQFAPKLGPCKFDPKSDNEQYWQMLSLNIERGINAALNEASDQSDVNLLNDLKRQMTRLKEVMSVLQRPTPPFDVIAHGDFCRNNLLFKYSSAGEPTEIIFIDLQNSEYTNVCVDLSFFLYMHTTAATREEYWDRLLSDYYTSFASSLPSTIEVPKFEAFLHYFAGRAMYGYVPCSFFLPAMLMVSKGEDNQFRNDSIDEAALEEMSKTSMNAGGEEGEALIKSVVTHMLKKGYVREFLHLMETSKPES